MAKDTKRVIDETVGAFKRLKEEVKAYKDELATLTAGSEEWRKTAEKLRNAQKQVDAINKAAKGTLTSYNKEQVNSINELKERIKLLNQERNAMDMNSKEYKEATAELKSLNDKLREAGTSAGDWKANVGNYAESIKDAFGQLGGAATGLSGNMGVLNASMLKLASNPIGAVVLALVGAIKFLAEGIKSSEENTNKWNEAMVPVKTILTMIQKAAQDAAAKFTDFVLSLQKSETAGKVIQTVLTVIITMFNQTVTRLRNLKEGVTGIFTDVKTAVGKFKEWATGLQKTFEPVTKFVGNIYDGIKEKLTPVIDWIVKQYNNLAKTNLGKIFGLQTIEQIKSSFDDAKKKTQEFVEEFKEVEKGVEKTTEAENKLGAALRGLTIQRAKLNKELAEAQAEYAEAVEQKDWKAAQEALNKVKEKSIKLAETEVAMRAAEADVIRKQNALTGSTAEAKMAEANATAAVIDAQAGLDKARRDASKQQDALNKKVEADTQAEKAEKFASAITKLNAALKGLENEYKTTVSTMEAPIKPEIMTPVNTDEYYNQIKEQAQLEYEAYAEMMDNKILKLQEFVDEEKKAGNNVEKYELELAEMRKEQTEGYAVQHKKMIKTQEEAEKNRAKTQKALNKAQLASYADLFDGISGLFEQDSIAYKATAVAKAIVSTYLAASEAFANAGGAPWGFVPMAASIAAGLAQVKQILSVNEKGENSMPSSNSSSTAVAQPSLAEQNPYTYTRTLQTSEEEEKLNQPVWVSVQEINRVQERVRVTDQEATF